MKKLIGVLALSVAIPVLQAGVYSFSTLHQSTGASSAGHDLSASDHKGDSRRPEEPIIVNGDSVPHVDVAKTPEPGFYGLMALGFGALAVFQVRKRRQA